MPSIDVNSVQHNWYGKYRIPPLSNYYFFMVGRKNSIPFNGGLLQADYQQKPPHTQKMYAEREQYAYCCRNLLNIWLQLCHVLIRAHWSVRHAHLVCLVLSLSRQNMINIYCSINKLAILSGSFAFGSHSFWQIKKEGGGEIERKEKPRKLEHRIQFTE